MPWRQRVDVAVPSLLLCIELGHLATDLTVRRDGGLSVPVAVRASPHHDARMVLVGGVLGGNRLMNRRRPMTADKPPQRRHEKKLDIIELHREISGGA